MRELLRYTSCVMNEGEDEHEGKWLEKEKKKRRV